MTQGSFCSYCIQLGGQLLLLFSCQVMSNSTPWTAAFHASLSFTISWSLLKLMSTDSMMLFNNLIHCRPLLLPSISSSIRAFSSESALPIRWPKHCPLSCFADTEALIRWKKLTVCCSQAHLPRASWNQKVMILTSNDLTTT